MMIVESDEVIADSYQDLLNRGRAIIVWYRSEVRPLLKDQIPDRLLELDNDAARLERIIARPKDLTVCFLGHSGIGKSTLLNAVAAGQEQILPAGGIGPLTAQATEVHFSGVPSFKVSYHKRSHLWRIAFALERAQQRSTGALPPSASGDNDSFADLDEKSRVEIIEETDDATISEVGAPGKIYVKQAAQMVAGDQFAKRSLPYLIDCLRIACGYKPSFDSQIENDDRNRIERIRNALQLADDDQPFGRCLDEDPLRFKEDLNDHAAGFIAPLIRSISVGWPSDFLNAGIKLVDLPGVGIAQDAYRRVTRDFIGERARAIVLVVDKSGPTEETVELLRTSGYWDRLVGAADDPESDPCDLIIAVTKVDDVAGEEWRNLPNGPNRPRKKAVYAAIVEKFQSRMRVQISDQLGRVGVTGNEAVATARAVAREQILSTLKIFPVSAPEYRKLILANEDELSFLQAESDTGVPDLRNALVALADAERIDCGNAVASVSERLQQSISGELSRLDSLWREQTQAAEKAKQLEAELESIMVPLRQERDLRVGAFREFLEATAQTRVRELVHEAREVAEEEVEDYLLSLRGAHWATLRAAVSRGGTYFGQRAINLPDDIAGKFQEPMAAVWGQKLLKDLKSRTGEFSRDQQALVEQIFDWAKLRTEAATSQLLSGERKRQSRKSAQLQDVGKEAIIDLRKVVKQNLSDAIKGPIQEACEKFVREGKDSGTGVKNRIIDLFQSLAKRSTQSAQEPANRILKENFATVRNEITSAFNEWGNPLEGVADVIVHRHSTKVSEKDAEMRVKVLLDIERVKGCEPTLFIAHE